MKTFNVNKILDLCIFKYLDQLLLITLITEPYLALPEHSQE